MRKTVLKTLEYTSLGILLCIFGFVLFYLIKNSSQHETETTNTTPLKKNVKSISNSVDYVEYRNGKPFLRVIAEENLALEGNVNKLKTVKAIYYGKNSSVPTGTIRADYGNYSSSEDKVIFDGHVQIKIKDSYSIRTSHITYSKKSDIVKGLGKFSLGSKFLKGSGKGFRIDIKKKHLKIFSNTSIIYRLPENKAHSFQNNRNTFITSDSGEFWDTSAKAVFQGNVNLKDSSSNLSGESIELAFTPDHHLKKMLCSGNSYYRRTEKNKNIELRGEYISFEFDQSTYDLKAVSANKEASLKSSQVLLKGNQIKLESSNGRIFKHLFAQGSVLLESSGLGSLNCSQLRANLDSQGIIQKLDSLKNCSFTKNSKGKIQTIEGQHFIFTFNLLTNVPTIKTFFAHQANHILFQSRSDQKIEGSATDLTINYDRKGKFVTLLKAANKCRWKFTNKKKKEYITLESTNFSMHFFPDSNDPMNFFADGNVDLHRSAPNGIEMFSHSDHLEGYIKGKDRNRVDHIIQKGNFTYHDSNYRAKSGLADFKEKTITLTLNPQISTEDSITSAETISIDLKNEMVIATGKVEAMVRSKKRKSKSFGWLGQGEKTPIYIHADNSIMDNKKKLFTYKGSCRMVKGKNVLTAHIIIIDKTKNTFNAHGNVYLLYFSSSTSHSGSTSPQPMQTICDHLTYSTNSHILTMTGKVTTHWGTGTLKAKTIKALVAGNKDIQKLTAFGEVTIHWEKRFAYGDRALYIIKEKKTILQGKPARVIDRAEGRTTEGAQLTFYRGNDKILVQNSGKLVQIK